MATSPSAAPSPPAPGSPKPQREGLTRREPRSWLLERLDSLLSEPLREAPPADLVRHRVMAGATCFLLILNSLYMLSALRLQSARHVIPAILIEAGYLGALVLARRARTPQAPAMLLLVTLSLGLMGAIFATGNPYGGTHATAMLLPALAVYLVGPRLGLIISLAAFAILGVLYPLHHTSTGIRFEVITPENIWYTHVFAGLSFLGAWVLGSLHSTSRGAAQEALEQMMGELHLSQNRLNSLIESTDDLVVSIDLEGRLLTTNAATRRMCVLLYGREPVVGELFLSADPERLAAWQPHLDKVRAGQRARWEDLLQIEGLQLVMETSANPIIGVGGQPVGITLFARDISARKEAEVRLGELHRTLVDVSRHAGMAEIATGVLHNVGNTLNSVNISTNVVTDRLRHSRIAGLTKAAGLLKGHAADLSTFLTQDPQGRKLPLYLIALAEQLQEERDAMLQEMRALGESVEHIKSIVSMQQKHARAGGALEEVALPQLIDEALRLHAVSFERYNIHIEREYAQVPPLMVDRHKLLQILINLLSNARHALADSPRPDKRLRLQVQPAPEPRRVLIVVADNGAGIAPENLPRIFTQGFTTKKKGHGFGLHISALAATEMKGRLTCASPGPGEGATFTLELPLEGAEAAA
jgi:PAS domain S-box-containing protein